MASSSYSQTPSSLPLTSPHTVWDVFLSFRGKYTRYSFTDHLYKALHRTGIRTFMDNPELRSGEVISDSLIQAIQHSKTYIVVLSENYASSSWCLDELVEILRCYKTMNRLVVPVFYYIDPFVVRHQIESFKEAFDKHQTRYGVEKLNNWRLTLNQVADFSGYHISKNRSQADIVNEVVERVLLEINPVTLYVAKYPVGLDSRVKGVTDLFNSDVEAVIKIGIHGMGGVGKTTLAKAVYNQNYKRFQGSCFLANVREVSGMRNGLVSLQQQLIADVLKCKNINIGNIDQGIELIRARICSKKVLIVIDDLDDLKPLEHLQGSFSLGSVVIITTRNEDLLDRIDVKAKYKVNHMDKNESLQLFSQHAFGVHEIPDKFMELSKVILEHAAGHPLALQIFGTTLLNESEEGWRSFIDKFKLGPIDNVEKNLMISFNALKSVPSLQDIFLEIACFYIGLEKTWVSRIMETCYTYVNRNIDILNKRCLITIDEFGTLGMHDLLQDMGRNIALNNSREDMDTLVKNHKGTEAIRIISGHYQYGYRMYGVTFVAEPFKRMSKLKFLSLNDVNFTGSFKQTFKDLRSLCWILFPLECLPSDFYTEKLFTLELPSSNIRRIWKLNMAPHVFENLKTLNMSDSRKLQTTPDFIRLPSLQKLNLEDCISLEEVNVSIGSLVSLVHLNLGNCYNLRSLPDSICSLRALEVLTITGCSSLEALPTELGSIESLKSLNASGLSISKLPYSIGRLSNLVELGLSRNKNLETLPNSICNLTSLEILDIIGCKKLKELPDQLGMSTCLRELKLEETMLRMLPDISQLSNIKALDLSGLHDLVSISELPTNLEWIGATDCTSLKLLTDLSGLKHLKTVDLSNCVALQEIQGLEEVTSLEDLCLYSCRSLKRLPNLCNLKHLRGLELSHCFSLKDIIGLEELSSSEYLGFGYCGDLLSFSKLPPNLDWVAAEGCKSLSRLPNLSNSKQLKGLFLTNCSGLTEIQGLEELTSLRELHLVGCSSSLQTRTLTKRFFEIISGYGHKVEISTGGKEFLPSEFGFVNCSLEWGILWELGSRMSLDLQPNASRNLLAIILAIEDTACRDYDGFRYSVKNITSGFIWSDTLCQYLGSGLLIVVVPSSILSIRDGDKIELKSDQKMICGIHLLYKTENTMTSEYFSTTENIEDEGSNPLYSDLESNKNWLSLGNSVENERSYKRWKGSEYDN